MALLLAVVLLACNAYRVNDGSRAVYVGKHSAPYVDSLYSDSTITIIHRNDTVFMQRHTQTVIRHEHKKKYTTKEIIIAAIVVVLFTALGIHVR